METNYEVLGFEDFSEETSKLIDIYNALNKRFVPLPLVTLLDTVLETLNKYKGDRTTQAKVLTQLALELKNDPNLQEAIKNKTNKNYIENAQQIMLGGLIHRYYRIKSEYPDTEEDNAKNKKNTGTGIMGFFKSYTAIVYASKPEDCRLYTAIKEILKIGYENNLDALTIVSGCNAFKTYMEKDSKYTKYEHFNTVDPNFFENLDVIINNHKEQALPRMIESNKLRFLQQLSSYLKTIQKEMLDCLTEITKSPLKGEPLSRVWIEERLKTLKVKEPIQKRMLYLLEKNQIKPNLCKWSLEVFNEMLSNFVQSYSAYVLFGAYLILLFDNPDIRSGAFKDVLKTALHCDSQQNKLDKNNCQIGLDSLDNWFLKFDNDTPFTQWGLFQNSETARQLFLDAFTRVKINVERNSILELNTQSTKCTV